MYGNFSTLDNEAYENLANAVVEQAAKDYTKWKMFRFRHPVKTSYKVYDGQDAEHFLKSENLMLYTSVPGEYILTRLDADLAEKQREITLRECHKEFINLQGITKKGKKKC